MKQRGEYYKLNRKMCGYTEGTLVRVQENQTTRLVTCVVINKKMQSTGDYLYPSDTDLAEVKL